MSFICPHRETGFDLQSLESVGSESGHTDWVNFAHRIRELDDRDGIDPTNARMGDVIIIADTRQGYNAVHEGHAYPGWHGGPSQADSEVPLLLGSTALRLEGHNVWLHSVLAESRNPSSPSTYRNEDMSRIIIKLGDHLWK